MSNYEDHKKLTNWLNVNYNLCQCQNKKYRMQCHKCSLPLITKTSNQWCKVFHKQQKLEKELLKKEVEK